MPELAALSAALGPATEAEPRARVNLPPDLLRVAAWSALQGHDALTAIGARVAAAGTTDATRAVTHRA